MRIIQRENKVNTVPKKLFKKCVLFDLDGTLVSTGDAGLRALEKAFQILYKIPKAMKDINPAGKTDPKIIREIFWKQLTRNCNDTEMRAVQEQYLHLLDDECENSSGYMVMKGIPEIIRELEINNVLTGLGTGNLEKGARIKLKRSGLNDYLPFGGFGSDSEHRTEVLKIAHQRAEIHCGSKLRDEEVYVVGDTERDILAAREAKYKVISVATGHTSHEILLQYKPDFFLPNFENIQAFLEVISNGHF